MLTTIQLWLENCVGKRSVTSQYTFSVYSLNIATIIKLPYRTTSLNSLITIVSLSSAQYRINYSPWWFQTFIIGIFYANMKRTLNLTRLQQMQAAAPPVFCSLQKTNTAVNPETTRTRKYPHIPQVKQTSIPPL
jgi:hypothetical protein